MHFQQTFGGKDLGDPRGVGSFQTQHSSIPELPESLSNYKVPGIVAYLSGKPKVGQTLKSRPEKISLTLNDAGEFMVLVEVEQLLVGI
jgi:hypothetical protein